MIHTEETFEATIEDSLVTQGGYQKGNAPDYSPDLGLFKYDVIRFLQESQPENWQKAEKVHGKDVDERIIQRLCKALDLEGSLHVLRNGFVDYGIRFQMAYFMPATGLNPDAAERYQKNELKVYRQIYYSHKNKNSVDMVLAINGIPVATLELKNQFTEQNTGDALQQYAEKRDNRELLFVFKKRTLVHFAVDQDEVFMTTKLDGQKTFWLPFNKGNNNGKGNPINKDNYKTAYLWESVLAKDSLMEIIQRFVHLETEKIELQGKTSKKQKMIFPRYHQLDCVRQISKDVSRTGAGKNYLVQHSAGSGKSNSIAWLAYRLSSLHDDLDKRIFDSIIVVTDRRVLDQQLLDTIYQFEHKSGIVQKIDKDSQQLADALGYGTNIIITTLQKFPFVIDKVGELPDRKYAVIIDEAHSSQGGETSKKMKEVLAAKSTKEQEEDDYTQEDFIREQIQRSAEARSQQSNISFFAFTATPKPKTLQVFGIKDDEGKPKPFHYYSMRQAIEEGFILDVLQNYTTFKLYCRLAKSIDDDPKVRKKEAAKALGKYISLHPHNVAQKTEVIIEHFRLSVAKKIGGLAKAMLVCSSRLHAKRYYEAFQRYIKEKGYGNELKVLVAFSGTVVDDDSPEGVSEPQLTGYSEKEIPDIFEQDAYKILIVADKYQTGFDQPLLHTMYVDKKLSGVKAVQTLSRLNRTYPGKEDTFVLDFVNDREDIMASFQPFYEVTTVKEEADINHLYDLKTRLDEFQVYWEQEIDQLANIYFHPKTRLENKNHQKKLYAITDHAVDRYKSLEEERQEEFKKSLRTWVNLYAFLSQIMPFSDESLEKFYAYARFLMKRLPKRDMTESLDLADDVAMEYYKLERIKEGSIELEKHQEGELSGTQEAGLKKSKEEQELLSNIIHILNDKFGTEFEEADRLFFNSIEEELMQDENLEMQAKANTMDSFQLAFEDRFLEKLIGRMDQNKEIFEKIIEDQEFGNLAKSLLMRNIYRRFNG